MDNRGNQNRVFLFLQGPHGPFFSHLAKMLNATGAQCYKVGFNRGVQFFWSHPSTYIPFRDRLEHWPKRFHDLLTSHAIPRPKPFNRLLSKVQGVMASANPFWPR